MPAYVNIPDIVKIGLIAVVFIWLANKALKSTNLSQFAV